MTKQMEKIDQKEKSPVVGDRNEQILVRSAIGGSSEAFGELVRRYYRRIKAVGLSFFKHQSDREDFVEDFIQDVFMKAYTKLSSFRGESLFSTWLTRIAYTTAVNSVKRRKQYLPLVDEASLYDPDWTPEEEQMRKLAVEAVRQSMQDMPEQYAQCLDLYFFQDMSYAQICQVMDMPLNTVKSYIFRAKKMLREKLADKI